MRISCHLRVRSTTSFAADHSKVLLDTHLYTLIGRTAYFDKGEAFEGRLDDTRHSTSSLRKSHGDYYLPGNQ